jgi:hypothetical protein
VLYRLRRAVNYAAFKFQTRGLHRSPPTPCDPDAGCTVHTMLGRDDLPMYLVAVKSLLRFRPRVAVMAHSDGTLGRDEEETIRRHVPGVRIVTAAEADELARTRLDAFLTKWRSLDASWRRVIDTELWCPTPKRIIMDSDILTIRRPDEVIAWIEHGTGAFLFGQPPKGDAMPQTAPGERKVVQTVFREKLSALAEAAGLPAVFPQGATSGFYGCGSELSLERIARVIRAGESVGIPMTEWGAEQCLVLFLLTTAGAPRLSAAHYINYDPSCYGGIGEVHVAHFYGTHRFHRNLYPRLAARVIAELNAGPQP